MFNYEESTISGYFIKSVYAPSVKFYKDDVELILNIKSSEERDGGTYYTFTNAIKANKTIVSGTKLNEIEVFTTLAIPSFNISTTSIGLDSISIGYESIATEYDIYLDGILKETILDKVYTFDNLSPNTDYVIKVVAKKDGYASTDVEITVKTEMIDLVLNTCNRINELDANDSIVYTFNKDISTFTNNSITDFDGYTIDGNTLSINLVNAYDTFVNMDFTVTDIDGDTLNISQEFITIKKVPAFNIITNSIGLNSISIGYQSIATEYDIYLDGILIETIQDKVYTFDNLKPNTDYIIKVVAKKESYADSQTEITITTDLINLVLETCNRSDKINVNDSITYVFNKDISTFTNYSITDFDSYTIDGNTLSIKLTNDYETVINMDFTVTDIDSDTLTISQEFNTIKKGGIFMTFDFTFVTGWVSDLVTSLTGSAQTILLAGLGLLGLITGAFFLIGLGKKAVKKSK